MENVKTESTDSNVLVRKDLLELDAKQNLNLIFVLDIAKMVVPVQLKIINQYVNVSRDVMVQDVEVFI